MKLIVGLGNPGEKYLWTRHNVGFMALNKFIQKNNPRKADWEESTKFHSQILKVGSDLLLAKPQTYMNNSGLAVNALVHFYKVSLIDLIIVHDDLDLLLGRLRIRMGGSAGGHHGVESIISNLGSDQFIRLRIGIGNQSTHLNDQGRKSMDANIFVTEEFQLKEKTEIERVLKKAVSAIDTIITKGFQEAQNEYNQ